jgi:hypothetical protein
VNEFRTFVRVGGPTPLDHVHDFGLKQSKIMNVIDSYNLERDMQISLRNLRKLDCAGKPVPTFPHPALELELIFRCDSHDRGRSDDAAEGDGKAAEQKRKPRGGDIAVPQQSAQARYVAGEQETGTADARKRSKNPMCHNEADNWIAVAQALPQPACHPVIDCARGSKEHRPHLAG